MTARCPEAAGANPPFPASCLALSAHRKRWSNSSNHPSAPNTHFPLLLPHSFHLLSSSAGDNSTAGCDESLSRGPQGLWGGSRYPPEPCKTSQQHCLAGLMGRAGSMQFPVIPEPAQMSPLIICCVGSLALPAPCIQQAAGEVARATNLSLPWCSHLSQVPAHLWKDSTCFPQPGGSPFSKAPIPRRHSHSPPHPCSLQVPNPGSGHPAGVGADTAGPPGSTDTPRFTAELWSTTQQRMKEQGAENQPS